MSPPFWQSEHVQLGGDHRAEPEHAGGMTYLILPGKASGSPQDLLYPQSRNVKAWSQVTALAPLLQVSPFR